MCLNDLAWLFYGDKQLDATENTASRAINLIPEKGNEYFFCQLHRLLGLVHRAKGDNEKAIHYFQTALKIASPLNVNDELFWNHYNLAGLFRDEDKFDDANSHIQQAKSLVVHETYRLGRGMEMQALIWYRQRRLEEAKSEALQALQAYEKLGVAEDVEHCRDLLQNIERAVENRLTRF